MTLSATLSASIQEKLLGLSRHLGGPLLGIESSGKITSLCCVGWREGEVLELRMDATALPSDVLAETLSTQLHEAKIPPSAIKAIVVGIGPGSFTGIRVGLATAKGLGLGAKIPLYGISSLSALALSAGEGYCAVVLDARQEEYYTALYHIDGEGHPEPLIEDGTRSLKDFKEAFGDVMANRGACSVRVVGDAANALLGEHIASCVLEVNAGLEPRMAFSIGALEERLRAGDADHLQGLSPRYMRLTAAERNLKGS